MQPIKRIVLKLALLAVVIAMMAIFFKNTAHRSQQTSFHENSAEVEAAKPADYKNCVVIRKDQAMLYVNNVETGLSFSTLREELPTRLTGINNLNIIYSPDAEYSSIVQVLNAVTKAKMETYRLLKM